jgi:hypothetical protein
VPYNLRVFYRWLRIRMREATPEHRCPVYFIHKDDIRQALRGGRQGVPARAIELHWELTHALADYDDDGDIVTLFCQHNIGADPADQMEDGDRLVGGGTVPADLLGMFSSATDLNQVRRHVVDLRRGRVETRAFPEVGDREHFAFGLNLLPPLQLNPYLSEYGDGDVPNLLRACRRMDATYWVAGGWLPQTMSTARVHELPPRPPRRRVAAEAPDGSASSSSARRTPTTRSGSSASRTRWSSRALPVPAGLVHGGADLRAAPGLAVGVRRLPARPGVGPRQPGHGIVDLGRRAPAERRPVLHPRPRPVRARHPPRLPAPLVVGRPRRRRELGPPDLQRAHDRDADATSSCSSSARSARACCAA